MELSSYIGQFKSALKDEIVAVRSDGGQKTYLSEGRHIATRDGLYVYSFTADSEVRFPDETSVDVEYHGIKREGLIVSSAGFDVILALKDYVGDSVPTAILYTAPWFLLDELHKRLAEIETEPTAQGDLILNLLDGTNVDVTVDLTKANQLLRMLGKQLGKKPVYNEHQLEAVGQVLGSNITFIWGPPGTGKTSTLGLTAAALATAGQSVLIVAHSNVAVDVAMRKVAENLNASALYRQGQVLRYGVYYDPALDAYPLLSARGVLKLDQPELIDGYEALDKKRRELVRRSRREGLTAHEKGQVDADLRDLKAELTGLRAEIKEKEKELVAAATVVGCTLSKAAIAPEIYKRHFDAVLLDEASMAYIPHCAFVAGLAQQRIAIYGDFRQLPPIAQAETPMVKQWLLRDIFEQAGIIRRVDDGKEDGPLVLLATQYRMHPAISAIPNRLFYKNRLKDGPSVGEWTKPIADRDPSPGSPLALYDSSYLRPYCFSESESHSRFNLISALAAVGLAARAVQADQKVCIITPYNAQSRLINRMIRDLGLVDRKVQVATVHRFQGSESAVILFDAVEGLPKKPGRLVTGGSKSIAMRLANVAISRAQGKFAAVGDYSYIREHWPAQASFRRVLDSVVQHGSSRKLGWPLWGEEVEALDYFPGSRSAAKHVEADLIAARDEIAIVWPAFPPSDHFSPQVLKQCDSSRVRFFISGSGSSHFQIGLRNAQIWQGLRALPYGIIGIDRKRLWIYLSPNSPQGVVLKLDLPETSKLLYAFWRLVPDEEIKSKPVEERIKEDERVFRMPCQFCGSPLMPTIGRYGPYLACTREGCGYTKRITAGDATDLARVMGITCGQCDGQAVGRSTGDSVFLGCSNYPKCRWTKNIRDLI